MRENNNYTNVYDKIVKDVNSRVKGNVLFEITKFTEQCCVGVSMSDLESLSDEEFVKTLYFKFLDRPASKADIVRISARLKIKQTTMEDEIDRIMKSSEYVNKNIVVKVIK